MTVDSQLTEKGLDAKVLEKNRLQGIVEKYKLQGCKELGYTNIIVPFTKDMSDDNVLISDNE